MENKFEINLKALLANLEQEKEQYKSERWATIKSALFDPFVNEKNEEFSRAAERLQANKDAAISAAKAACDAAIKTAEEVKNSTEKDAIENYEKTINALIAAKNKDIVEKERALAETLRQEVESKFKTVREKLEEAVAAAKV